MSFKLDQRLEQDTHAVMVFKNIHIRLHKNSTIPWFIVVPETNAVDMDELSAIELKCLMEVSDQLSAYLKKDLACDKINVATIGNIVRQFHFHVIGRYETDPCWPGVVWGANYPQIDYDTVQLEKIIKDIKGLF